MGITANTYQAEQWRTVDITITTQKHYVSPFEDVDVTGLFTGPDGQQLKLLAFWDGGGTWVLRFAPTSVGTWSCEVSSTDTDNTDFTGTVTVTCVPYTGTLAMYQHGFLRVSEDKDYLEHADGTPFFWLGDTHWTFVTEERFDESNWPGAAPSRNDLISGAVLPSLGESQFKACVDKRVQQKFTVYQCNFRDGKQDGYFGRNLNLMQEMEHGFLPNIKEFQENVDKKMKYLADQGLLIAVGYAWGYDMPVGGVERYKKMAKYTAARYGAYPVVWTLAGELPGYMGDLEENTRLWNEVARECARWNAYGNLQSVHLACARPFPQIYENEDWFDFAMSQAGHGDYDMAQSMYSEFKEMYAGHPVLESEGNYEGAASNEYSSRPITAAMMRRLAYLIMQSGGCGYTYGALGVWELQWEKGVGGIGWGDLAWWDGLNLPGANQLTIFRDFYESVNWSQLKPLPKEKAETKSFFMEASNRSMIYFTGDASMRTIVGYMSETSMRSFVLRGLTANEYHIWEMDPATGEKTEKEQTFRPVDGVLEYSSEELFGNKSDRLVVVEAVN
ncbi:MAG: DUF4038 domain-containing protein [Clostridiales bacterium]|nr:DUF4038 domain-containing protein [Clostridiales bacterium]